MNAHDLGLPDAAVAFVRRELERMGYGGDEMLVLQVAIAVDRAAIAGLAWHRTFDGIMAILADERGAEERAEALRKFGQEARPK